MAAFGVFSQRKNTSGDCIDRVSCGLRAFRNEKGFKAREVMLCPNRQPDFAVHLRLASPVSTFARNRAMASSAA